MPVFEKDIRRPIETVIKADDSEHILVEMEEYVVTREIVKRISRVFSEYNEFTNANGVWISGFFGSGKSHLLKILSYVLENREFDRQRLGEVFAAKIKEDDLLREDILRAIRIPAESILFNIDQQAQYASQESDIAILNVFYKVFNDFLGYFGGRRHVAEFERWLDDQGLYHRFIELFERQTDLLWNQQRRQWMIPKFKDQVAQTLGNLLDEDPSRYMDILDRFQKDDIISVEDLTQKILRYLDRKGPSHRLNFFVDEVGQFISGNTKLMLNLQTIAESLATAAKGRVWIFVTAQENLESVVGDLDTLDKGDFTRIQARFSIRVPLTSANVDEVIEKRLLAKTPEAEESLARHWDEQMQNLRTLISFSEPGIQFRHFKDAADFTRKFPFLPYQFDLFQQCIRALSQHNAFQGKHASVGERSMLGVFQQVAATLDVADTHDLVPFDRMFEGLRTTIRGELQNAIALAERNIQDEFVVRVLKVLFLVKYERQFKTTAHNIAVLMTESSRDAPHEHHQRVQKALDRLESETYIQRSGESYEFLTNEEKDVENEIKSTAVDGQEVSRMMGEILFDSIIGDNKIAFRDNRQDYAFTRRIDGIQLGRDHDLAIEILTPNVEDSGKPDRLRALTMGNQSLALFALPDMGRMLSDVRLYLKTERYYKQNLGTANASVQRILIERQQQNVERKKEIVGALRQALGHAVVYLNGSEHRRGALQDGANLVADVFQDLVRLAFPNLSMAGHGPWTEDTLKAILTRPMDDLFAGNDDTMSEAEQEMLHFLQRRNRNADPVLLADLRAHFSGKPYGWSALAVFCMLARLFRRGKVEIRRDAALLDQQALSEVLTNNRTWNSTRVDPVETVDPRKLQVLRATYQDLYHEPCPTGDFRFIVAAFQKRAAAEARELQQLLGNRSRYPFLQGLDAMADMLERLAVMDARVLLNELPGLRDELLEEKENRLDPIRSFWTGERKAIYDQALAYLEGDRSNFEYVDCPELQVLEDMRAHPRPYLGDLLQRARTAMEAIKGRVMEQLDGERRTAGEAIAAMRERLTAHPQFARLEAARAQALLAPLDDLDQRCRDQRHIANLRGYPAQAEALLGKQLGQLLEQTADDAGGQAKTQYILKKHVVVRFPKNELETPEDVEAYVERLREEYLRHIGEHRRILL